MEDIHENKRGYIGRANTESSHSPKEKSETLGELIKRRMYDLRIYTAAELARRLGYSRSYVTHLVNDTSPSNRGYYLPAPEVVKKLSEILSIGEIEILKAIGYLS